MLRNFEPTQKDFEVFIDLFIRTGFSYKINEISNKLNLGVVILPDFNEYCSYITHPSILYKGYTDSLGNIIAGVKFYFYDKHTVIISHFVVCRNYQLQGIGKCFYKTFEKYLKIKKVRTIKLNSMFDGSIIFWKKMGFNQNGILFVKSFGLMAYLKAILFE